MFAKLYRQYENMTQEARFELMRRDGAVILPALAELNGNGAREFIIFMFSACGEGGMISPDEYTLLCEAVGDLPDYSGACEIIGAAFENSATDEIDDAVETLALLGDEAKSSLVSFCLCFCASRGKGFRREKRFLKSIVK